MDFSMIEPTSVNVPTLDIKPLSIEDTRHYITNAVVNQSKPDIRRISIDLAVCIWEVSYFLAVACAADKTHTLTIANSEPSNNRQGLSTAFIQVLVARIPFVTVLTLKPVNVALQVTFLGAYCGSLVKLTLHSSSTSVVNWPLLEFSVLEEVDLLQDRDLLPDEESLPLLFSKFVLAPKLVQAALLGIAHLRYMGVREFLLAFGHALQGVKILGNIGLQAAIDAGPFPVLPRLTDIHLELSLAERLLCESDISGRLPKVQRIVFESGWQFFEAGIPLIDWEELKDCLLRFASLKPTPVLVCGYRGIAEARGDFYVRTFADTMLEETGGWNVLQFFDMEQMLCPVLPDRALPVAGETKKRKFTRFELDDTDIM